MNTEQKIKEAFDKYESVMPNSRDDFESFEAGYMALLNELIECGSINDMGAEKLYRLPEGVMKP